MLLFNILIQIYSGFLLLSIFLDNKVIDYFTFEYL